MTLNIKNSRVRNISGAPENLISNESIKDLVEFVTDKTKSLFEIELEPTKKIEILDGDWKNKIVVDEYFPLKVLELRNGNTTMDLDNVFTHTEEGMIQIHGDTIHGQYTSKFSGFPLQIKCKYLYGAVERNNKAQTENSISISKGVNVSVVVENTAYFSDGDYLFFESMSKSYELAKVVTIDSETTMTIDRLNNDYEIGSLITNSRTMKIFEDYILYETAIAVAINAIGSSYVINTGYSLGKLSAQKGVPYPHWKSSLDSNIRRRDELKQRIQGLLGSII